jgi:hypothetical protein
MFISSTPLFLAIHRGALPLLMRDRRGDCNRISMGCGIGGNSSNLCVIIAGSQMLSKMARLASSQQAASVYRRIFTIVSQSLF